MKRAAGAIAALLALLPRPAAALDDGIAPAKAMVFGGDAGASLMPGGLDVPARAELQLALRLGTRFTNGVTASLGYRNLGLRPHGGDGLPWQLITVEVRYTFFNLEPNRFVEAVGGPSLVSSDLALSPGGGAPTLGLGAGFGGGIDLRVKEQVALEVAGHVLATPALGTTLLAFTLGLGVEVDVVRP